VSEAFAARYRMAEIDGKRVWRVSALTPTYRLATLLRHARRSLMNETDEPSDRFATRWLSHTHTPEVQPRLAKIIE
jgi:hypothetical protein